MIEKRITVIGCGMVGRLIATDLGKDFLVTAVDKSEENLELLTNFRGKKQIANALNTDDLKVNTEKADLVLLAVPGFMGFKVLESLLALGKNVVDISFFPEDANLLNETAKNNNCFAMVDCGIAPGFSHLAPGYYATKGLKDYTCYVGGLPFEKTPPFAYKAPFSPVDVIEEYTRPARFRRENKNITQPPLTEYEILDFEKAGVLEAFVSDGLRSLLNSYPSIPNMIEKTLRHPGHAAAIKVLLDGGLLSDEGDSPTPLEFNSKILFNQWKLNPEDDEFTFMRLLLKGENLNKQIDIYDRKDFKNGFSSMARTTGYTACAVARKSLEDNFTNFGVFVPEILGEKYGYFEYATKFLKSMGITIEEKDL